MKRRKEITVATIMAGAVVFAFLALMGGSLLFMVMILAKAVGL